MATGAPPYFGDRIASRSAQIAMQSVTKLPMTNAGALNMP